MLELYSETKLPTSFGEFLVQVFRDEEGVEHLAISVGDLNADGPCLARVHSACFTGEALSSLRCDCKAQLEQALVQIQGEGRGVVFYLFQEGRGIGLGNKIRAYALQEQGHDTVDANLELGFPEDLRSYDPVSEICAALGIQQLRLMTNNPEKLKALQALGLQISERVPLEVGRNAVNAGYLDTKAARMGHLLEEAPKTSYQSPDGVITNEREDSRSSEKEQLS